MQVARPREAHFTGVGLIAYGAMLQVDPKKPRFTDEGPAPHSAMATADVQCHVEDVDGAPYKITCTNGKPSAITDPNEKRFRDRLEACLHTNVVALSPQMLRDIEASIPKNVELPGTRPAATVPFVSLHVDRHVSKKPAGTAIWEDDCKGVHHPCDPARRWIVGYNPPDPNAKPVETRHESFAGFGPEGYVMYPNVGLPAPLFRGIGVETIYAAPMLEGDKPDPRFVVQRYKDNPFGWEPPPKVSPEAVKETYERLVALDPDRENDATQVAILLDRAVLAYAMRDGTSAKRYVHDLDAWLARHPDALPKYDYAKQGMETLHLLESGKLSITDPCTP
jgi:hypothetical protein